MAGDDYDVIDKTQWLPHGAEIVLPEQRNFIVTDEIPDDDKRNRGGKQYRSIERPLDCYLRREQITEDQYDAGIRFHKLWHYSVLRDRYATMSYGATVTHHSDTEFTQAIAPRDFFEANNAIRGNGARRITRRVCLWDKACGSLEYRNLLLNGLDDLVAHFSRRRK